MDQKIEHTTPQQDDQLADFADQVINGRMNSSASNPTDDRLGLKETILRLNSTFPPAPLDDAAVKQMYVRLKSRIRREEQAEKPSFWKKWFGGGQFSAQLGLAFALVAILVVALVSTPLLATPGSTTTGTASSPVNFFVIAGLAGVLIVIYWFTRRK